MEMVWRIDVRGVRFTRLWVWGDKGVVVLVFVPALVLGSGSRFWLFKGNYQGCLFMTAMYVMLEKNDKL